jgi:predicted Zn finger-like uncharacterized protein
MNCIYIRCPNCEKIFELEKILMPEDGCDVKCSSCKNVWFYNPKKLNLRKIEEISEKYPGEIPKDIESLISDAESAK